MIHTDDFASLDNPTDWWPSLLEEVIEPLVRGDAARYRRYDSSLETRADWHTIEPAPIVIIEGVSAGRSEWAAHLSFLVWIETPTDHRLRRCFERDGIADLSDWDTYEAEEHAHYARDPTRERADMVIDGTQPVESSRTDRQASSRPTRLWAQHRPLRRNGAVHGHRSAMF